MRCILVGVTRAVRHHRHSYGDYLLLEEESTVRHEYLEGEIYAMVGGTPEHAALAMKIGAALVNQLRDEPCQVMSSDLRVRVLATGLATYPDVTVVCGPLERDPASHVTVVNPRLVVEVLSNATEEYDRGEKLAHYRQMPSLMECLLVSHRERRLESWRRDPDGSWSHHSAGPGETLMLGTLGCRLVVDDIYRGGLEQA